MTPSCVSSLWEARLTTGNQPLCYIYRDWDGWIPSCPILWSTYMVARPIITSLLLWSIGLEPFVATLDPGKGGASSRVDLSKTRGVVTAPSSSSLGHKSAIIVLSQLYTSVAVVVACLSLVGVGLSLVSSFYVYALACCVAPETSYPRPIQCLSTQSLRMVLAKTERGAAFC